MAITLPIVEASGQQTWSGSISVIGHTGALKFRVSGGTFDDNSTEIDIIPDGSQKYAVGVKANVTVGESATQPVLVYYQNGSDWTLVESLSKIFVLAQQKKLDYRILLKGFDALPLGASLSPTYNGLVLGGGVRNPTAEAMQAGGVAAFSSLGSTIFDLTKPISFVYDRQNKVLYWINAGATAAQSKVFGSLIDVDLAGYFVSYNSGQRTVVLFYVDGTIETYNNSMTLVRTDSLGYSVNRVVCRRANVGTNTALTYVAIDTQGQAHYLTEAFVQTQVRSDHFYVNASDSYDVLSTLDGQLVGTTVTAPNVFWYQFVPSSFIAFGHDGTNIYQANIRDGVLYGTPRALIDNDCLVFNTTAAWTQDGGKLVAGMDTNGSDALFNFASADSPAKTRDGWSYVELITPPYTLADTYDRLFYYAARPTQNLKHLAFRNYNVTLPALDDIEVGPTVSFTLTVDAEDPDLAMPIIAPAGVTLAASVGGKPVTEVYDGQEVTITLSGSYITSASFPISIGRSVHMFEVKSDDKPNAFSWQNVRGIDNDTWHRTEDIVISGINVPVAVTALVNGLSDPDRLKIFVDGQEVSEPVILVSGQTLGFEVYHEDDTTSIDVTVGSGHSRFGLFTVVEEPIDVGRHWAYAPVGVQVRSDILTNTSSIAVTLTITETDAYFVADGNPQTIVLQEGESTRIAFTPTANNKYTIKFSSAQLEYEWFVWADAVWQGTLPASKRGDRYTLANSGPILFENIPDNFWTTVVVPAGMLLDVDGVRVELPLDSRGVYSNQGTKLGPFECSETILQIYGFPSQLQPHTLMLGDAPLPWEYDLIVDPVYEHHPSEVVRFFDMGYDQRLIDAQFVDALAPEFVTLTVTQPEETQFFAGILDTPNPIQLPDFFTDDQNVVQHTSLPEYTSPPAVAQDQFDLFEIVLGKTHVADSFWPGDFFTDLSARSDTFITTFTQLLLDQPQMFELADGRKAEKIFPKSELVGPKAVVKNGAAEGPLLDAEKPDAKPAYQLEYHGINTTRRRAVADRLEYPEPNVPRSTYRQPDALVVKTAIPSMSYPISMGIPVKPVRHDLYMDFFPYGRPQPQRHEASMHYWIGSAQAKWYKPVPAIKISVFTAAWQKPIGLFKGTEAGPEYAPYNFEAYHVVPKEMTYAQGLAANKVSNDRQRAVESPGLVEVPVLEPAVKTTPPAARVSVNRNRVTSRSAIRADVTVARQKKTAVHKLERTFELWSSEVDYGQTDPLKEGYFASELAALQNATQVWGFDPSVVYAIQQPNGTWTWAQVTICEETCGSMSCAARGYLSGG